MYKVGDNVVYKNKCMKIVDVYITTGCDYKVSDVITGKTCIVNEDNLKASDKCIDNFYNYGEIE